MSKRSLLTRVLILPAVLLLALFTESVLQNKAPWIKIEREFFFGDSYPASASDYLPFTLPPEMDYRHQSPEFDVHYRTNGLGYRGRFPEAVDKPPGRQRLLVNGDSFTLGWGNSWDDSFVGQLQRSLGAHWEVINAGYRGGYSPDSYYAFLMREGLALNPDLLLQVLFTANDLTDMRENRWYELDELGAPHRVETLRLYTDYQGRMILTPERRKRLTPWYLQVPLLNQIHLFVGTAALLTPARGEPERPLPMIEAWRRFGQLVEATQARTREAGIPLLYVLIPPDPRRASDEQLELHQRVGRELAAQGAHWMDLLPALGAVDGYFDHDAHFNREGNAIAAQGILQALVELGSILPDAGG